MILALRLFLAGENCDRAEYLSIRGDSMACDRIIHGGANYGDTRESLSICDGVEAAGTDCLQVKWRGFHRESPLVHGYEFASARARRQGTGVLGRFSKAPTTKKMEMALCF